MATNGDLSTQSTDTMDAPGNSHTLEMESGPVVEDPVKKLKWGGRYRMLQIIGILVLACILLTIAITIAVKVNQDAKMTRPPPSTTVKTITQI